MKAEERKHLEQNELLTRLTKWWKEMRSGEGKPSNTLWIIAGCVALAAILIGGWQYFAGSSKAKTAALLAELDYANTPEQLEAIADRNKGTPVGRAARLQIARVTLIEGMNKLGSDTGHAAAVKALAKARTLYEEVGKDASGDADLVPEALLCRAKAEEALTAVPNPDNKAEILGNLDKALELYEQVAARYADSAEGKEATSRAKDIKENKAKVQAFYEDLEKRMARAADFKIPTPPFDPTGADTKPPDLPITPIIPKSGDTTPPVKSTNPLVPIEPPKKPADAPKPADKKPGDAAKPGDPKPGDAKPSAPAPAPKPADPKAPADAPKPK